MPEPTKRSFVAIELPSQIRESLAGLQKELRGLTPPDTVRWTRPESIHLTLQFLGDVPAGQIVSIGAALEGACTGIGPFDMELKGTGVFPNPRRPRIVWAGVIEKTGRLVELHAAVGQALAPLGYPPEARAFTPHLTIGRAARSASSRDLAQLGAEITRAPIGSLGHLDVDHIRLMESQLKPTGAVYRPQVVIRLQAGQSDHL